MKERVEKQPKQQRIRVLARSKVKLDENGNRLTLILGILACIVATISISIMASALYSALALSQLLGEALATTVVGAAQAVLCFFTVFPLYLGVLRAAGQMCRGEDSVSFATFFTYYHSFSAIWRAWIIQLRILWRAFPIFLVIASSYVPLFFETTAFYDTVVMIINLASPLLIVLGFFTTCRSFSFAILAVGDDRLSLRVAVKRAKRASRKRILSILSIRLRMLLGFVLSLLSIGVVTLIHTLPLTLLVYSELAGELSDTDEL